MAHGHTACSFVGHVAKLGRKYRSVGVYAFLYTNVFEMTAMLVDVCVLLPRYTHYALEIFRSEFVTVPMKCKSNQKRGKEVF